MLDSTVLPMAFGTIACDLKAVRRLLALNQEVFLEQLERLAGKVEMGVRVKWDVPNVFEYFVDIHPELRVLRDRLLGTRREPRQEDRMELGQLFARILDEDREAHAASLEEALAPCCAEIKRSPLRQLNEVANLNCLAGRNGQRQLEGAVFRAASLFDNNYAFDLNGPWAPHNFVRAGPPTRRPKVKRMPHAAAWTNSCSLPSAPPFGRPARSSTPSSKNKPPNRSALLRT